MISIIAAVDQDWAIGKNASLPWRLPGELARFKKITTGHPIIMGRKTYESIGRPLPGRTNIVVTRHSDFSKEGVLVAHNLEDAFKMAQNQEGGQEIFVIGGAEIFKQVLSTTDRLYLTMIEGKFEGDVFFPKIDLKNWKEISREKVEKDSKNNYNFEFITYERRR